MFTPLDLKNKTFTKGFRGYETEEVDKFFAQVVKDFERLYQDNIELKETVERVSAKLEYYQQMEATMQNALVVAQETADEVKKTSEKKAQVLLDETTAKCEGMKTDARNEADRLLNEAGTAAAQAKAEADSYAEKVRNEANAEADKLRNDTEAEMNKLKADTQQFVNKMRIAAEVEVAKLKVKSEESCKNIIDKAREDAVETLGKARMQAEKTVSDADARARKLMFDAENKAALAKNSFDDQVKKANVHRQHMINLLESQLELLKSFDKNTEE